MVQIAIAGGAGNVAQEIVDVLVATKKHEIMILTRRNLPINDLESGVKWIQTDYRSVSELTKVLEGVHTVLSFLSAPPNNQQNSIDVQKRLIDASIRAGVKRFAPSEWVSSSFEHMDWYAFKTAAREYLADLNKNDKVLEYCLFQPGLFTNYLVAPHRSAKHLTAFETPYNLARGRMLVVEHGDDELITFTTVQDLANVVARAIEFESEWPVIGGMVGTTMSIGELIALGEKVYGDKLDITRLKTEDLENGTWSTSWVPLAEHPTIAPQHVEAASRAIVPRILLAVNAEAFLCSDEWNKLLPDIEFTGVETFLEREWRGKA